MPAHQANVEYWFRLLYECVHGACYGSVATLASLASHIWLWIVVIGYALSVAGLIVIVYATMQLFELRKREEEYYRTPILVPETAGGMHPRWTHIQSLLEKGSPSEWREAITEADIMLEDSLTRAGYEGNGVGEKLKRVDGTELKTLQDAWEAHKVRNQIAHQGSAFDLSETVTQRTIAHYEAVFRELNVI